VHLVGFIIRIYHDARSRERHILAVVDVHVAVVTKRYRVISLQLQSRIMN